MPTRNFESFVEAFSVYLSSRKAPKAYHLWAGLWCLSAAIERRASCFTNQNFLWPNIYVVLLGPPANGKSQIIDPCSELLLSLGDDRHTPSSMTFASLADHVRDFQRTIIDPKSGSAQSYSGVNILSSEWKVLLPTYDTQLLGKITDLYDCKRYSESRRSEKNNFVVERTCCTMCVGTTPIHLFGTLPESAWSDGFLSRCFIVYSEEVVIPKLFGDPSFDEEERIKQDRIYMQKMKDDLKDVSGLQGRFRFAEDAALRFAAFAEHPSGMGGPPHPRHPRLAHYAGRRGQHLLKLGMLSSIDRKDDLIVEVFDYERAYEWLIGMELNLPDIFRVNNAGGDSQIVEDMHHEMVTKFIEQGGKPLRKSHLTNFLMSRVQTFRHDAIIKAAVAGGWFKEASDQYDPAKGTAYIPADESPFIFERKELKPRGAA